MRGSRKRDAVFLFRLTLHASHLPPLALAASLLTAGCAMLVRPSPEAEAAFQQRRAQLETIQQFTLQARVSAGLFGVKGNLHWRQGADDFRMRFSGPMGAQAVNIAGTGQLVEVRTAEEVFHTTDPETFLREKLGWTFPVRQLRWWVLGTPAPYSPAKWKLDETGRVLALEQDGWTLEFDEYRAAGTRELPRKLELAGGEATIKVVIDAWTDLAP